MAEPEVELETTEEPEIETPEVADLEPETTEEPEEEIFVPTVVRDYMPSLADGWGDLSEAQQKAALADLGRAIDRGDPGTDSTEDTTDGTIEPVKSTEADPARGAQAHQNFDPPDGVADDVLSTALDDLGWESDSPMAKVLKALVSRSDYAVNQSLDIGQRALDAIDELGGSVQNVTEESQLVRALENHAPDFRGMKRSEYDEVVKKATAMKKAGRVKDFNDAVSLALLDVHNISSSKPKPSGEQRRDIGRIASSLATTGRGKRRAPALSPGKKTIRQIFQHAQQHGTD